MTKGTTIKDFHISSTLELVGVGLQMFENLYKRFGFEVVRVRGESLLHAAVVVLAGSCEYISLTQREIRNCAVEQLTSLCAGSAGPQPTHTS